MNWVENIDLNDQIQATAYAIDTLLHLYKKLDDLDKKSAMISIENGLSWLASKKHTENGRTWWDGGIFFAGGTIVRDYLRWRSDSYTTAVILETLSLYQANLDNKNFEN